MISVCLPVCRAAQEASAPHRGYIDRKKENVIFTPLYLGDPLSDWIQICYTVSRQPGESTYQISFVHSAILYIALLFRTV